MGTYELRHRDHTVLLFQYSPVRKILEIISPERLPVPVENVKDFDRKMFFDEWYKHRITNVRTREKRAEFGSHRVYNFISEDCADINFGANLADHYWICPEGSPIKWKEINYFDNDFVATDENSLWTSYGRYSPDNHTNGNLRKFWTIQNGIRYLAKYNSLTHDKYQLGAHNEVFCMKLLQKLGVPCAEYSLCFDEKLGEFYSLSKCMTDTVYELVPAFLFLTAYKKPNHISYYDWFLSVCREKLGIDVRKQIDEMICLDFLIANEDRHWNNFALLRNSETLQYVGLAPLYDHEYSMGYFSDFKTRTFKSNPQAQLKLIDLNYSLNVTKDMLLEIWEDVYEESGMDKGRSFSLEQVRKAILGRLIRIERILQGKEKQEEKIETEFQMYTR